MVNTQGSSFTAAFPPLEPVVEMRVGPVSAVNPLPGGHNIANYQLLNFVPVLQDPTPVITITKVPPKTTAANQLLQPQLACGICAYKTTRRDLLTRHVKTHEAEVQQCDQCEFASSRSDVLSKHKKTVHEGVREAERL
jgi:Zinc finger, C2H2 type